MQDYIEQDCTFTHNGKSFTSGGAIVTPSYLMAYPSKGGMLTDWHGNAIGTYSIIGTRPAVFFGRRSWQGSTYYYMRAHLHDGSTYSLRGFGIGMLAMGKRVK